MGEDAWQVGLEVRGEALERLDAAAPGLAVPALPGALGIAGVAI